jgi:hypothetical protein
MVPAAASVPALTASDPPLRVHWQPMLSQIASRAVL